MEHIAGRIKNAVHQPGTKIVKSHACNAAPKYPIPIHNSKLPVMIRLI